MWHDVMAEDEIPVGGQKVKRVGEYQILFCRTQSGVHAIENLCSHAAQPLAGGRVNDDIIRCPSHGARFDLKTGVPVVGRLDPVKTFPVQVENNRILVAVDD